MVDSLELKWCKWYLHTEDERRLDGLIPKEWLSLSQQKRKFCKEQAPVFERKNGADSFKFRVIPTRQSKPILLTQSECIVM